MHHRFFELPVLLFALALFVPAFSQSSADLARAAADALEQAGFTIDISLVNADVHKAKKNATAVLTYDDGNVVFSAQASFTRKSGEMSISCADDGVPFELSCRCDRYFRLTSFRDSRKEYGMKWSYPKKDTARFPSQGAMVFDKRIDAADFFPIMAEIFKIDSLFIEAGEDVVIDYDAQTRRIVGIGLTGASAENAMALYGFSRATLDLGRFSPERMPLRSDPFEGRFLDASFDFFPGISREINSFQLTDPKGGPAQLPCGADMVHFMYNAVDDSVSNEIRFTKFYKPVDVEFRGTVFSSIREEYWTDDAGRENYLLNLYDAGNNPAATPYGLTGLVIRPTDSTFLAAAVGKDTEYVPLNDFLSMGRFGMYWSVMEVRGADMVYQASFRGYGNDDPVVCYMGFSDIVIRYSGMSGVVEDVYYKGPGGKPALHAKYKCARISTRFSSSGKPLSLGFYDEDDELIRVIPYKEYAPADYQFFNPELIP